MLSRGTNVTVPIKEMAWFKTRVFLRYTDEQTRPALLGMVNMESESILDREFRLL
jgi:hypothetical protein